MNNFIDFFIEVGKLKKQKRSGWVLREVKNPETIAEHSFRVALMGWLLADKKEKLNIERIIKMALIHDIGEVYAGDITPYDSILPKNKKDLRKLMRTHPRFSNAKKRELALEKHKKEWQALVKITSRLERKLREEILDLWFDYEEGQTKEGRFLKQVDKVENLLQALEYWKKDKKFPIIPWWIEAREIFNDSVLLEFIESLDKKFHSK
ncbi:MAG: HD domain-containing protein [Candidatus Parcubacteria bacterium]|nr:HD domain-containing protein [Candidatus Parcubacteria bacterium]